MEYEVWKLFKVSSTCTMYLHPEVVSCIFLWVTFTHSFSFMQVVAGYFQRGTEKTEQSCTCCPCWLSLWLTLCQLRPLLYQSAFTTTSQGWHPRGTSDSRRTSLLLAKRSQCLLQALLQVRPNEWRVNTGCVTASHGSSFFITSNPNPLWITLLWLIRFYVSWWASFTLVRTESWHFTSTSWLCLLCAS